MSNKWKYAVVGSERATMSGLSTKHTRRFTTRRLAEQAVREFKAQGLAHVGLYALEENPKRYRLEWFSKSGDVHSVTSQDKEHLRKRQMYLLEQMRYPATHIRSVGAVEEVTDE